MLSSLEPALLDRCGILLNFECNFTQLALQNYSIFPILQNIFQNNNLNSLNQCHSTSTTATFNNSESTLSPFSIMYTSKKSFILLLIVPPLQKEVLPVCTQRQPIQEPFLCSKKLPWFRIPRDTLLLPTLQLVLQFRNLTAVEGRFLDALALLLAVVVKQTEGIAT